MSATRVTNPSARSRSCVATTTIAPSDASVRSRPATTLTAASSRPVNGSSKSTRRGWCTRARSRASRCRIPREKPWTSSSARSVRPARSSAASTIARSVRPYIRAKNVRFCRAESSGYRYNSCARRPIRRRSAAPASGARRPPNLTSPLVGIANVASSPISVDLPAPFGPSRPTMSPALNVSDTRDSARRRPKCRETSVS